MAAVKFKVDHLTAIVDHNGYQQTGSTREVLDLDPIPPKWEAFGWAAQEIDGHDLNAVLTALQKARDTKGKPSVIIARTVKGYPIADLLSEKNYHGKALSPEDAKKALAAIGA
jgi:transketolase